MFLEITCALEVSQTLVSRGKWSEDGEGVGSQTLINSVQDQMAVSSGSPRTLL